MKATEAYNVLNNGGTVRRKEWPAEVFLSKEDDEFFHYGKQYLTVDKDWVPV